MKKTADQIRIGDLSIRSRIVMPPMGTYKCDSDGFVTDAILSYYSQRAKNPHVGLIITEHAFIDKRGKAREQQMSIAEDGAICGLKKLVDTIHAESVKTIAQLNFGGAASPRAVCGCEPLAPSAVILPTTPQTGDAIPPKEMTVSDIQSVVQSFVTASVRAKSAGYDGVEIHSAHAYLLNQFYSPLTNKRTDAYGGILANRLRIHQEVLRAVRAAVGKDFLISVRLGGYDDMEGGNTLQDAVDAAKILAAEEIDLLSLTGGMCRYTRKGHTEPGYFRDMAEAICKEVDVPLLLTGGIKTLTDAQMLLDEDVTDFVGVGRPLLADPNWMLS